MRILLDENISGDTADALRFLGHDIINAPRQADDDRIFALAKSRQAILITRDRDFLSFVPSSRVGIVVVRIHPSIAEDITAAIQRLLASQSERWLRGKILILRADGFEVVR